MKEYISLIAVLAGLLIPALASAHERQVLNVGGTDYLFVVGSQNEPVVVDDKSGVELFVKTPDPKDIGNSSAPGAKPVIGLEQALKVEIKADGKSKTLDFAPVWNDPGHYTALFFPTKATTLTYRIFGTLNNTPIDVAFTCMPGMHMMGGTPDLTEVKFSDTVTRKYQAGMFSCPMEKMALGFPEGAPTAMDAEGEVHEHMEGMMSELNKIKGDTEEGSAGVAIGTIALLLAVVALVRTRKSRAG